LKPLPGLKNRILCKNHKGEGTKIPSPFVKITKTGVLALRTFVGDKTGKTPDCPLLADIFPKKCPAIPLRRGKSQKSFW
jgi:hypothetical protein